MGMLLANSRSAPDAVLSNKGQTARRGGYYYDPHFTGEGK